MKKATNIEEIRVELQDTMGGRHRHVIDEEDEENLDDDDVYLYMVDMHLDEQQAYRVVVWASKAIEWNQQQEEHFLRDKRKIGICKMEDWLINLNNYCFYQLYQ